MVKDHLGIEYKTKSDMCKAYGIAYKVFYRRISLGWSLEEALTEKKNPIKPNSKACKDHLGNDYYSAADMCRAYGMDYELYRTRKRLGWTFEEILNNRKRNSRVKEHADYLGNVYKSETAMCKAHGVDRNVYRTRIKLGWTNKEALLGRRDEGHLPDISPDKLVYDYKGIAYRSSKDMCDSYGVNYTTYATRLKSGYTQEEALTGIIRSSNKRIIDTKKIGCYDHLGNAFESETSMCEFYKISLGTYKNRIKLYGWSIEKALTKPVASMVYDHLNQGFSSAKQMCKHYGVRFDVFYRRRKLGWSLEEALTDSKTHTLPGAKECQDHEGNTYESYNKMCKRWGIDFNVFKDRYGRLGWTLEESLTIPKSYSLGEHRVTSVLERYCKIGMIDSFYHNITIKKTFKLLNMQDKYDLFMEQYERSLGEIGFVISRQRLSKFRFDFTLVKDSSLFAFIEFDGKQHFNYIDVFFKTLSNFIYRYCSDIAKNTFTETNRIPLLRIRYDQDDNDTIEYMITDLFNNPEKYIRQHNTFLSNDEYMSVFSDSEVFMYPCMEV